MGKKYQTVTEREGGLISGEAPSSLSKRGNRKKGEITPTEKGKLNFQGILAKGKTFGCQTDTTKLMDGGKKFKKKGRNPEHVPSPKQTVSG